MGSKESPKADFDFGPYSTPSPLHASNSSRTNIVVYEITAPEWIDQTSMYYRLAYRNAASPIPYAQSQWVMSPAALLTQRLRENLSPSGPGEIQRVASDDPAAFYTLRSELVEFEQVFDQPGRSRGVLRLRATFEGRGMWAQRTFVIEKPAPTADAAGGVAALSECADELAVLINQWAVASPPSVRDGADSETPGGRFRATSSRRPLGIETGCSGGQCAPGGN
jgi:ABC-type uncharacterized transport system auxiliary subunit